MIGKIGHDPGGHSIQKAKYRSKHNERPDESYRIIGRRTIHPKGTERTRQSEQIPKAMHSKYILTENYHRVAKYRKDGILMRKYYGECGQVTHHQILIPEYLITEVLKTIHGQMGKHPGITKMIQECRSKYYHPGLAKRIKQ